MTAIKANIYKGRNEKVGPGLDIVRSLPNHKFNAMGSVVFVDHLIEKTQSPKKAGMPNGSFAHPHRGIATFTYIMEGSVHHLDSNGGEGKVYAGGIQWMKAGNGIVHDEFQTYDFQEEGGKMHGMQIWLNLPAVNKAEAPDYKMVKGDEVPEIILPNNAGKVRVLLGEFEGYKSVIPTYLGQFMGHVHLKPGKYITLPVTEGWEYGMYVTKGDIKIDNQIEVSGNEIAALSGLGKQVTLTNEGEVNTDLIVFGGEPYTEPMVAYGPFIMNTKEEIELAYSDYQEGKYGKIDYSKVKL